MPPMYYDGIEAKFVYYNGKETTGYYNGVKIWPDETPIYSLTLQNDGHGTVTANALTGHKGDTVTLSPTYNRYYRFNNYGVTGGTIDGNTFTFGDSNATAKANFKVNSFTARGNLVLKNPFSGYAYGGALTAKVAYQITACTGHTGSGNYSWFGTSGSSGNNFVNACNTANIGWKHETVNSALNINNMSAFRLSGNSTYRYTRKFKTTGSTIFGSTDRENTIILNPIQGLASTQSKTGAGTTATRRSYTANSAVQTYVYTADNPVTAYTYQYYTISAFNNPTYTKTAASGSVSAYPYSAVASVTGTWSASGIAP